MKTYVCLSYLAVIGLNVLCEVCAKAEETIDDRPYSFSRGIDIGRAYVCRRYAEIYLVWCKAWRVEFQILSFTLFILQLCTKLKSRNVIRTNALYVTYALLISFILADLVVSIRSKRAVRAGPTEQLTHLRCLSCVGTRCSQLQSVCHVVNYTSLTL